MKRGIKKFLIVTVSMLVLIGLFMLRPRDRIPVECMNMQKGDVEEILTPLSNAMVRATLHLVVKGGTTGEVEKILVEKGDLVKAGALILELKNDEPLARLELAEANLKSGIAALNQTKIRSASTQKELDRARQLLQSELVSEASFEKAETESKLSTEALSAQESNLQQLSAQLKIARSLYDATFFKAPFAGVVADIFVGRGELVIPGAPVYELVDRETVEVTGRFDEIDAARLKPGMEARITTDAIPGRVMHGKVARISTVVSSDSKAGRGVEVTFSMEDLDPEIRIGMSVNLEVVVDVHKDVFFLPTSVILGQEGKRFVYIIRKGRLEKRPISTGLFNWEKTEILDGLPEGDPVVSSVSLPGLKEGSRVRAEK